MTFDYKHGGAVRNRSEALIVGGARAINVTHPFDYLFPDLARDALAKLSVDQQPTSDGSCGAQGSPGTAAHQASLPLYGAVTRSNKLRYVRL